MYRFSSLTGLTVASVPSKKILHLASVGFSEHAAAQQCGHATSETFQAVKALCDIYKI